jgi:hypothetical protein
MSGVYYTKNPERVRAYQVCWANWETLKSELQHIVSVQDNARYLSKTQVHHTCGEEGPVYIGFAIPINPNDPTDVYHGDWIVCHENGMISVMHPLRFKSYYTQTIPER